MLHIIQLWRRTVILFIEVLNSYHTIIKGMTLVFIVSTTYATPTILMLERWSTALLLHFANFLFVPLLFLCLFGLWQLEKAILLIFL